MQPQSRCVGAALILLTLALYGSSGLVAYATPEATVARDESAGALRPARDVKELPVVFWAAGAPLRARPEAEAGQPSPMERSAERRARPQAAPWRAASAPAQWTTVMAEDFEGSFPGPGWRTGSRTEGYEWGQRRCRVHRGSYAAWAHGGGDIGAALPCGSDYPDDLETWLVYGPFSLANASAARLTSWYWLDSEPDVDTLHWRFSIDGRQFYGWEASGHGMTDWQRVVFDLADVPELGSLLGQSAVWLALIFESDESVTWEGAFVDDIEIAALGGEAPSPTSAVPARTPTRTPPRPTSPPGMWRLYLPRVSRPAPSEAKLLPVSSAASGHLRTASGHGLYVPPGAVPRYSDGRDGLIQFSVETGLTASQLPAPLPVSGGILGDAVKFGPDGFTFALPVETFLPAGELPGAESYSLLRYRPELGQWRHQPYSVSGSGMDTVVSSSEYDLGYAALAEGGAAAGRFGAYAELLASRAVGRRAAWEAAQSPDGRWLAGCFVFRPGNTGVCPAGVGAQQGCHYYLTVLSFVPKYPEVTGTGGWVMNWANFRTGSEPDSSPRRDRDTIFFTPQGRYSFCVVASEWVVPGGFLPLPGKWTYSLPLSVDLDRPCRNVLQSPDIGNPLVWEGRVDAPLPSGGRWQAPPASCPGAPATPTATLPYGSGEFQATLTWFNTSQRSSDLDLHLYGPSGMHVYYDNPRSADGSVQLDRDMSRDGIAGRYDMGQNVENIFSVKAMPKGDYIVSVVLYHGQSNSFQVRTIRSGQVKTYQMAVQSPGQEVIVERFSLR